jgi:hypothetical protein
MAPSVVDHSCGFAHEALLYAAMDEFVAGTAPFVREGVEAGEPVLVAVSAEKIDRLRAELNGHGAQVLFVDMAELGANPARIIPAWQEFAGEHLRPDRPVRGIGEPIWPERTEDELVECQRDESLLNVARQRPVPGPAGDPAAVRDPPGGTPEYAVDGDHLAGSRQLLARRAADAGLPSSRVYDLVLAANEALTNSIRHGGGTASCGSGRTTAASSARCRTADGWRTRSPTAAAPARSSPAVAGSGWRTSSVTSCSSAHGRGARSCGCT